MVTTAFIYETSAGGIYVHVFDGDGLDESTAASSFFAGRKWLAQNVDERFLHAVNWSDREGGPGAPLWRRCDLD